MIDIKCGPVTFNHNTICNLHREEWLRGGASGQEFMLVNSIHWKQEKWIIHVLLLQQETGGKEEEFRVMEIKRGECFKKKTVNHCSNAILAPFFKLMVCLRVRAKSLQSCQTPCNPMGCSILTARLLCPWGFSSQECWSGLLCPPPGDLPNPGIRSTSLMSPANKLIFLLEDSVQFSSVQSVSRV